jgi:integrase
VHHLATPTSASSSISWKMSPQRLRAHPWRVFFKEEDAPIRREISPHSLRRYFVTEALRRGVQISALMRATGHSTLAAMAPYIGLVEADVQKEFTRVSAEPWF